MKLDSFLGFMNTPIIKAKKRKSRKAFIRNKNIKNGKKLIMMEKDGQLNILKGLGTSTAKEFKQYFADKKGGFI